MAFCPAKCLAPCEVVQPGSLELALTHGAPPLGPSPPTGCFPLPSALPKVQQIDLCPHIPPLTTGSLPPTTRHTRAPVPNHPFRKQPPPWFQGNRPSTGNA